MILFINNEHFRFLFTSSDFIYYSGHFWMQYIHFYLVNIEGKSPRSILPVFIYNHFTLFSSIGNTLTRTIFHILRYSTSYPFFIALRIMKEICGTISFYSLSYSSPRASFSLFFCFELKTIDFHAFVSFIAIVIVIADTA